jgi:hypothetical protein
VILAGTEQITRKLLESIDIYQAAQQEPASRTAGVRRSSASDSDVTTISWCILLYVVPKDDYGQP